MSAAFDFVIVGGGSAGAVITARLSEDPACRVALIEGGAKSPPAELAPAAAVSLQGNAETDWRYTADPGKRGGLGLSNGRARLAQGRMLGGSSGINLMVYVRGHPADFDHWAEHGAAGWSDADVLPFFRKSEGLTKDLGIPIDSSAHNLDGRMGVSVRSPILAGALDMDLYFDSTSTRLGPDKRNIILPPTIVQPRSEGEIVLTIGDPGDHPAIRMDYYSDPHDLKVMAATLRRSLEIASKWPYKQNIGPGGRLDPLLKSMDTRAANQATRFSRILHANSRSRYGIRRAGAGSAASSTTSCGPRGGEIARGRCERYAQHGRRKRQRGEHHDRRTGG